MIGDVIECDYLGSVKVRYLIVSYLPDELQYSTIRVQRPARPDEGILFRSMDERLLDKGKLIGKVDFSLLEELFDDNHKTS